MRQALAIVTVKTIKAMFVGIATVLIESQSPLTECSSGIPVFLQIVRKGFSLFR